MNIFAYLKKNGIDTIDSSFYSRIEEWESWYVANVKKFHQYRIYNGKTHVKKHRLSLQMAKKVCEDIANLLVNEKVKITISGSDRTAEYVERILDNNKFMTKANEYQERKGYCGTVAYVPEVIVTKMAEDGTVLDGKIKINYVQAKNIYPVTWENGEITEVIFMFQRTVKGKTYAHFQYHQLEETEDGRQYVITNDIVRCTQGSGTPVAPEEWKKLKPFRNVMERVETGTDKPQFVIDKLNIVNNSDQDDTNPMGVAVFANSIDTLRKIDLEYDSYSSEFSLGRKRIMMAPEYMQNIDGNAIFDTDDSVFYTLPEGALEGGKPIEEINMAIRAEEHSKAINDDLNYLSMKCGFGTNYYRFENGEVRTATEVISENSDLFRTIRKHEIPLRQALTGIVMIIIRLGQKIGQTDLTADDITIDIDFDDSIIEDKQSEREQDRKDVAMGVMGLDEYRSKWYGEPIEEARKKIPEQMGVME